MPQQKMRYFFPYFYFSIRKLVENCGAKVIIKINKKRVYEDFLWALNLTKESQQFGSNICLRLGIKIKHKHFVCYKIENMTLLRE